MTRETYFPRRARGFEVTFDLLQKHAGIDGSAQKFGSVDGAGVVCSHVLWRRARNQHHRDRFRPRIRLDIRITSCKPVACGMLVGEDQVWTVFCGGFEGRIDIGRQPVH